MTMRLAAAFLLGLAACGDAHVAMLPPGDCNPCPETNPSVVGGLLFCQCFNTTTRFTFAIEFPIAPASLAACASWTSQWTQFVAQNCR
jgi:hypothetical protein